MRWRRTPAGMVRIKKRDLIELQRDSLRAHELERTNRQLRVGTAKLEAQARLFELGLSGLTQNEREAASMIAERPPLTDEGCLHKPAFVAAVDAAVWAQRERELAKLGATPND